jgi:hypothetical protein
MSRRSLPLLALVATLGAPGIVGCSGEEAPVLPKFRVGTAAWAGFSPLNVAEAKGFFDAEGIDVEVVPFEEGAGSTALQAGTIDANLDVLGVFVNRTMVGKDDLKILAELDWSYGGDEVILRPPVDTSVAAIRAKTKSVGVYSKTASNLLLLDYYLKDTSRHADWGLAIDRVSVVERLPEELVTSFAAGEDALSLNYQPISTEQVRAGGEVVATSATYPGVISEGLAVNVARYAGPTKPSTRSSSKAGFAAWSTCTVATPRAASSTLPMPMRSCKSSSNRPTKTTVQPPMRCVPTSGASVITISQSSRRSTSTRGRRSSSPTTAPLASSRCAVISRKLQPL